MSAMAQGKKLPVINVEIAPKEEKIAIHAQMEKFTKKSNVWSVMGQDIFGS